MAEPASSAPNAPHRTGSWLAVAAIAGLMAAFYAFGGHRLISFESLLTHLATLTAFVDRHLAAALALYMLLYAGAVALSFPGAVVLTLAGGLLFGTLAGGTATVIAATLGGAAVFIIARSSVGAALAQRAGPFLSRLREGFAGDAFHYLLFLRLVPAFPFWLVNLAPALLDVPLRTFVTATALGIVPGTFAFAAIGAGARAAIGAQAEALAACRAGGRTDCVVQFDLAALVSPQLLFGLAALGLVALMPALWRRFKEGRA